MDKRLAGPGLWRTLMDLALGKVSGAPKRIFYYRDHYADRRNIINAIPHCEYSLVTETEYYAPVENNYPELGKGFYAQDINRTPALCHFFNYINLGDADYVTTFESLAPRRKSGKFYSQEYFNQLFPHIAADKCKALISISDFALRKQAKHLDNWCPAELRQNIMAKTHVLHPPQPILYKGKKVGKTLNFILVGGDFFRKGGVEALEAFERLQGRHKNFHLYIVSSLNLNKRFNLSKTTNSEYNNTLKQVQSRSYITWHPELPNDKVLELMRQCHVGLLPSFYETYGYSTLEMQASGAPVISTGMRALSEINNSECGWLLNLDTEMANNYPLEKTLSIRASLRDELTNVIDAILTNPGMIESKRKASLQRVRTMHDPKKYAQKLARIYVGEG